MHDIQQKLLILAKNENLAALTLRKIGEKINEPGSPQKIKHHVDKLIQKGLLVASEDGKTLRPAAGGLDNRSKLISLPIVGAANCGEAMAFADQSIESYLKLSIGTLGRKYLSKIKELYVLEVIGNSMNRANINNKNIEDGDYVVVDRSATPPKNGDYVVSIIEGLANIKKFIDDRKNNQIILVSESSQNIPPIYIHRDDYAKYLVCGRVIEVMKKPDEMANVIDASASDILKDLGPITKEEVSY